MISALTKTPILIAAIAGSLFAQMPQKPIVELEWMTWPEVKDAIHKDGKVNVIVYNGGVEQRGPQDVTGGHDFMAAATARAIALKMGNTLVAPILPYSVNEANPELPGTIGLTGPIFAAVNERVAEQLIKNGFKNVFLMGDHGGGQKELGEVARKLDAKYSPRGSHVFFCDEMYEKAQRDFAAWLKAQGLPYGGHAAVADTSEMLYLGGDKGWVRKDLIKSAVGAPQPGQKLDANTPRANNGITGDARPSTPELGKKIFDMKVDYAVRQMKQFLARTN